MSSFTLPLRVELPFPFSNTSGNDKSDESIAVAAGKGFLERPITIIMSILAAWFVISTLNILTRKKTPLDDIPGPWYAPYTTMHLRYGFATGNIWKFVVKQHRKHGDIMRLGPRQIWVANKEAMKAILLTIDLPKVTMYAEISRDRYSPGLFGEIRPKPHKQLKKFLGPAFTVSAVDKLDSFFMESTNILLQNYYQLVNKSGNPSQGIRTDLMRDLHCLALDIMGQSSFGKGFGQIDKIFDPSKIVSKQDKAWSKIPDAIFDGLANRYRFVFVKRAFRKIGIPVEFDWPKSMTKAISQLIDARADKDGPTSAEEARIDVLQHMLDEGERPDTGDRMSNQDIIDQMSELLLAGSETTSGTVACLFLELARNDRVREKLLKSLPILRPEDPVVDSKRVREEPEFAYLEACIKENLRMHPIASEMGRRTIESGFRAGDYDIPPYTVVSASYRELHLDERYWPKADVYWPERWLDGDEREGAPEPDMDAYYPFSQGKHACIGKNFAYAEIRTVSANLLSRFDVTEPKRKNIDFRQFITMQFKDGSWNVELTPRWLGEMNE